MFNPLNELVLDLQRIRIALSEVAVDVKMRKVRLVAPGKWMLCASFILPKNVAFSRKNLSYVD
jgi:tRNA (guanine37-N1)-methyltransferase